MPLDRTATRAGRKFQRDCMRFLRSEGHQTENLVLSGSEDEGDLWTRPYGQLLVIEAKREKGFHLADWVKQAQVERNNYVMHRPGLDEPAYYGVIAARRNHSIRDAYFITTVGEQLRLLSGR